MYIQRMIVAAPLFLGACLVARSQILNDVAADSVSIAPATPGNTVPRNSTFRIIGRFRNVGANTVRNVPVSAQVFRGNDLLVSFTGTAFPTPTPQNGVSSITFGTVDVSVTAWPGRVTVRINTNMRSPADQDRRNDTGMVVLCVSNLGSLQPDAVLTPSGFRALRGQFSDAGYAMIDSSIRVTGRYRNVRFASLYFTTARMTAEYFNGADWVQTAVRATGIAVDAGEIKVVDFGPVAPQTLLQLGLDDPFAGRHPNITPLYRFRIMGDIDDCTGESVVEQVMRFFVRRSSRHALVSVEERQAAMPGGAVSKSNKLNTDTLLAALDSINWERADGTGAEDFDLFDRDKWPKECLNFRPWKTVIWAQGAEPQGLEPEERAALKLLVGSTDVCVHANLIIAGQDIARIHDVVPDSSNSRVADQDFVRNYLRAEYRGRTNPPDYVNRVIRGQAIETGRDERIAQTHVAGDNRPFPAVLRPTTGDGTARSTHYYTEQAAGAYVDSSAGTASLSAGGNVVFYGVDWRHFARTGAAGERSGAQRLLLSALEFMDRHTDQTGAHTGDTVVTFTLRWNTRRTDLDLVLVRPDGQFIYWGNRRVGADSLLVDDDNGEGPEEIVYHTLCPKFLDSVRLLVFYSGPGGDVVAGSGGPATKATVFARVGNGPSIRMGVCDLMSGGPPWDLGRFDPRVHQNMASGGCFLNMFWLHPPFILPKMKMKRRKQ